MTLYHYRKVILSKSVCRGQARHNTLEEKGQKLQDHSKWGRKKEKLSTMTQKSNNYEQCL